ncbi:hypothetical protein [Erwinia sp. CGal63]|uniref:hypothetical protein n=1 Tax=Erwinia sp. CGal63 TaxID=2919889 RepID=UPI003009EC7B
MMGKERKSYSQINIITNESLTMAGPVASGLKTEKSREKGAEKTPDSGIASGRKKPDRQADPAWHQAIARL